MAINPLQIWYILLAVCSLSVFLSLVATVWLFVQYVLNWTQPTTQKLVMQIVMLAPVWAILALIIVAVPAVRYIVVVFLDLMEAFAILCFMRMIYNYLGGKDQAQWKASTKHPYRCFGCFCVLYPGEKLMKVLHVMIYQYCFFRPLLAIISCILYYNDLLPEGGLKSGNPLSMAITISGFASLLVAMWALLQVYRTFALILKPNNVGYKFLALKVYIWLHVIQGFVFGFLAAKQETPQKAVFIIQIEYSALCVEMCIGALLNLAVFFNYKEYQDPNPRATLALDGQQTEDLEKPLLAGDSRSS